MPKVKVNDGLVGSKIARLDGSVEKITEAIGRGYKTSGGGKAISSDNITKVKGRLTEIKIDSKRDIEDSGLGYAVLANEKSSKSKKAEPESKGKKSGKTEKSGGKSKKSDKSATGKKSKKAEPEVKTKKSVKSDKVAPAAKAKKVTLVEIDDLNDAVATEIRDRAIESVDAALRGAYSNIATVNGRAEYDPAKEAINVTVSIFVDMPKAPEFELSAKTSQQIAAGKWEALVKANKPVVASVCNALELDDYTVSVGDQLVDELGGIFFFAGISKDGKSVVLQNAETGKPKLTGLKGLASFDLPRAEEVDDDLLGDDDDLLSDDDLLDDEDDLAGAGGDDDLDEEESEEEEESDDPLEGMEVTKIAKLLKSKWARNKIEVHLSTHFELDEEDLEATAEMDDDELADYVANLYASDEEESEEEEEEEESEEESDDDESEDEDEDEDEDGLDDDESEEESDDDEEESDDDEEEDEESDEDDSEESDDDEEEEEEEESDEDESEFLTADDVNAMTLEELKECAADNEVALPKKLKTLPPKVQRRKLAALLIEELCSTDEDGEEEETEEEDDGLGEEFKF